MTRALQSTARRVTLIQAAASCGDRAAWLGERVLPCPLCTRKFANGYDRAQHVRWRHKCKMTPKLWREAVAADRVTWLRF